MMYKPTQEILVGVTSLFPPKAQLNKSALTLYCIHCEEHSPSFSFFRGRVVIEAREQMDGSSATARLEFRDANLCGILS